MYNLPCTFSLTLSICLSLIYQCLSIADFLLHKSHNKDQTVMSHTRQSHARSRLQSQTCIAFGLWSQRTERPQHNQIYTKIQWFWGCGIVGVSYCHSECVLMEEVVGSTIWVQLQSSCGGFTQPQLVMVVGGWGNGGRQKHVGFLVERFQLLFYR